MEDPCISEDEQSEVRMTSHSDLDCNDRTHDTSGARNSLHGVMYQLKHLMLILNRVRKMGYAFRLATEMDEAKQFDDLVLEYQDNHGNRVHRFMQMKHKQNETKAIGVQELFADDTGDFSLEKYFISWREVKRGPDFATSGSKYFILCTNVGIDVEALRNKHVAVDPVKDSDDFLIDANKEKQPPRYRLQPSEQSELYAKLKSASDVRKLAKALAECVLQPGKEVATRIKIFQRYQSALTREVFIHTKKKLKFRPCFIENNGLSPTAIQFRDIFYTHVDSFLRNKNLSTTEELKKISLKTSAKFGKLQPTESKVIQSTELPDDEVTDEEIHEFFDEFVLAVNQPNEEELDELISYEFGKYSGLNLLNTNFAMASFQRVMLNWFKTKVGRFLVRKDAEEFFDAMEHEISSLVTVGLNLSYVTKLGKYDVKFEKEIEGLPEFLDSSNATENLIWHLTPSGQTLLTALRIYQTIGQAELYKQMDSLIFIELENLLQPEIGEQVFRAFQSPRSHNLLVVDCGLYSPREDRVKLYERICEIMKKLIEKKILSKRIIIIIPQLQDDRDKRSKLGYPTAYEARDDTSIDELEKSSLRTLLEKKVVKFQGRDEKTSFVQLLGTEMFDNAEEGKLRAEYRRIIGPKTLEKLIIGEEIRTGNPVQGLGEISDYYIPRTIDRRVVFESDVFRVMNTRDLFVISGIVEEDLAKILPNTNSRVKSHRKLEFSHREKHIILKKSQETEHFDILCRQNPNENIHWLQAHRKSEKFAWLKSFGTVRNLLEYKVENGPDNGDNVQDATQLTDDQLAENDEQRKIVIISDTAGMGKSTVLTHLAHKIMENEPSLLVIKVNLTEHTNALDAERKNPTFDSNDTDGAINFLVDKLVPDLESEVALLLKTMIKARRKAALLFDAFDEISPSYTRTAIDMLQALAKLDVKKLFVTTRPHTSRTLEEALGVFSHTLQPFSEENQVDFLTKFWKRGLGTECQPETEESQRLYAQAVIELLTRSIDQSMKEFTGVPLQTRLVAESFSFNDSELPKTINIIELYRSFVDKKYQIFMIEKSRVDPTNLSVQSFSECGRQRFSTMHQKLALEQLFDEATVAKLLGTQRIGNGDNDTSQDISENRQRTGIVTANSTGKLRFIHRTFAEYFAAEFLVKILINDTENYKVREIFMNHFFVRPEYQTTRAFANGLLVSENNVLKKNSWCSSSIGARYKVESAFAVAVKEQNLEIVKFVMNVLEHCTTNLFLSTAGKKLLRHAIARIDLDLVTSILGKLGTNSNIHWERKALAWAINVGQLDVVQLLLQRGADIKASDDDGRTPLSLAAEKGKLSVVVHLLERGANIEARDRSVQTPLSLAAENGQLSVVVHLLERGANIEARTQEGWTPLRSAANHRHFHVMDYLLAQGANIEAQDKDGWTLLRSAAHNSQFDLMDYLLRNGANIEAQDKDGWTLLRSAAHNSQFDLMDYLLRNGANIEAQDKDGCTPLIWTVKCGISTVAMHLLEEGANIEARNKFDMNPLILAVPSGELDLTEKLLEKGANIEAHWKGSVTPLILAITCDSLPMVELLLKKGANTEARDAFDWTPLRLAICRNQFAIVKLLLEKRANIEAPDKHGYTPIHLAVKIGNLDIVQHLIQCGADINSQTNDGSTPLHLATRLGNSEMMNYLIQKGAR